MAPLDVPTTATTEASGHGLMTHEDQPANPYRVFFELAPDAVIIVDDRGVILEANRRAEELFGYPLDELIGMSVEALLPEEARAAHVAHRAGFAAHPHVRPMGAGLELWARRADGTRAAVDISLSPLPGSRFAAAIRDVTDRRRALAAAAESEARLRSVFDSSPIGMAVVDPSCRFLSANRALCDLLGYSAEELAGLTFTDVTPPEDVHRDVALAAEVFAGTSTSFTLQKRYVHASGRVLWAEVRVAPLPAAGEPRAVLMATDITDRKQTEADLAHRALHDDLTGVANRALALERLGQAVARIARGDHGVGVLFADLDHFKTVNDRFGHGAGDEVLRQAVNRMVSVVRPYDTVARLGGDEFVIVCDWLPADRDAARAQLMALAERIRHVVAAPMLLGEEAVTITASVGGAAIDGRTPLSPLRLLARADRALYEAKEAGRDRARWAPVDLASTAVARQQDVAGLR